MERNKEIKAFISDTHYSQNPNNLNKRLKDAGLLIIKWSFDDTRIPTNELAMILDNRRLEKSRKRQCIRTLEKANADIENYFAQIDAKYLTFYCPSGNKRVFSNQSKGFSVESRNVTIAEGYTIMGIESLKNNYGNYKQFVDDWDLKAGEREKDNNLGDMSTLFEGIDISEFPETAEEIPSSEDTAAASESDFYEEDMDAESENGQELLLEEIKNDKMHVYDYIPDKLYLVECHTMLGTINFSLVNNYMDVFGDKIPLYSLFIVQYNQGTSLGQLLQDVDLRQYNLQIPDKIIDEISDAVNYIRGYMGRE